jgi:hypothetical protein
MDFNMLSQREWLNRAMFMHKHVRSAVPVYAAGSGGPGAGR